MTGAESGIGRRRRVALQSSSAEYVERRKRIFDAAADAFYAHGYSKTSFDDIAQRADMDRASLYYYVGSKSDLFEAIAMAPAEMNVAEIEKIANSHESPDVKLRTAVINLMHSFTETFPRLYVYIREYGRQIELGHKRDSRMTSIQQRYDAAFESILSEGISLGIFSPILPTRELGYSIVGMIAWTNVWYRPGATISGEELGTGLAEFVLNGLRPGQRHPATSRARRSTGALRSERVSAT
jgi:TetR/AcrR family transcriptional regulator, cholesterol catabolism regulator